MVLAMLIKGRLSRREKGRTMSLINPITDKSYYGLTKTSGASQVQNQTAGVDGMTAAYATQAAEETGAVQTSTDVQSTSGIGADTAKDLSFQAQLRALTAQNAALTASFGSTSGTSGASSLLGNTSSSFLGDRPDISSLSSSGTSSLYGNTSQAAMASLLSSGLSSMGSLLGSASGLSAGSSMYGESMGMTSGSSLLGGSSLGSTASTVSALNTIYQDTVEKVTEDFSGTRSTRSVDLNAIFEEASDRYGIPSRILKAVAKQESGFKTTAVSNKGAMGVMQLMPATARSLGVSDPFDPRENIMGGAKLLASNLREFGGNLSLALAAYNAGSGNVKKYGGIPPFKETQNYVKSIMGSLARDGDIDAIGYVGSTSGLNGLLGIGSSGLSDISSVLQSLSSAMGIGMSSLGSLASMMGLNMTGLLGQAFSGSASGYGDQDGDGKLDSSTFANLVQLMRIEMMMQAGQTLGNFNSDDTSSI